MAPHTKPRTLKRHCPATNLLREDFGIVQSPLTRTQIHTRHIAHHCHKVKKGPCSPSSGSVVEAEAAAADHHAHAAGVGAAGGEDLHRQVSALQLLLLCLRLWVVGPRCCSVGCVAGCGCSSVGCVVGCGCSSVLCGWV